MKVTKKFVQISYSSLKLAHYLLFALLLLLVTSVSFLFSPFILQAAPSVQCDNHWTGPNIKLKDHSFFQYEDYFYFVSIASNQYLRENTFAYARTSDFCSWENIGFTLKTGIKGSADEYHIWAPYVIEDNNIFYMFYTGVNLNRTQSIMLATTTTPADPLSWEKQGVVFRPNHEGMVYPGVDGWSDNRDPMVLKYEGYYYLFYTGVDVEGGIIGVAQASSLLGPWQDLGAILPAQANAMLESPFVLSKDGFFYLYYNYQHVESGGGTRWRSSDSLFGPWTEPVNEYIGWAHDFALVDGTWYASYVIGNGEAIEVSPLNWLPGTPAIPYLGSRLFLPAISK